MSNKDKILYIEWEDHSSYSENRWRNIESYAADNKPVTCCTIGKILAENGKCITLSGTWGGSSGNARADQTILKNCIKKRRVITIK